MQLKPVSELMSGIIKEYQTNPENWHLLRSQDENMHMNTFISHADKNLWQFKTELKNPFTPIGVGACVKRNLNDEITELMLTGEDLLIQEVYPNLEDTVIALGVGKYSKQSSEDLSDIISTTSGSLRDIEPRLNLELNKLLKKEQLLNHYL